MRFVAYASRGTHRLQTTIGAPNLADAQVAATAWAGRHRMTVTDVKKDPPNLRVDVRGRVLVRTDPFEETYLPIEEAR